MPDVSIQIDPLADAIALTALVISVRMQRRDRRSGTARSNTSLQKTLQYQL
jgi:hypothetical protein